MIDNAHVILMLMGAGLIVGLIVALIYQRWQTFDREDVTAIALTADIPPYCPICKGTIHTNGMVSTAYERFHFVGVRSYQGRRIAARRCDQCGNVQLFSKPHSHVVQR